MYLPAHLVYEHILPHMDIDTRMALGVAPRKLDTAPFGAVDGCLRRQLRRTRHSRGAGLTWSTVPLAGGSRALVYRVCDGSRACDLVWRRGRGTLLHEYR